MGAVRRNGARRFVSKSAAEDMDWMRGETGVASAWERWCHARAEAEGRARLRRLREARAGKSEKKQEKSIVTHARAQQESTHGREAMGPLDVGA